MASLILLPKHHVYIYRHFVTTNSSWGITQNYSLHRIVNNFKLITNPIWNLKQFPLRISLFDKYPTAVRTLPNRLKTYPIYRDLNSSKEFAGTDGLILKTLAEYLNFDVIIVENSFLEIPFPNGTATGSLSDIVNGFAVLGTNSRFLIDYGTSKIELTVPHTASKFCVIGPKALKVPRWKTLIL